MEMTSNPINSNGNVKRGRIMSEEDEVDNRKCIDRCLGVEPGMGLKAMMLNRLMLCIIAVCLLWMTSFGVCKGIVNIIVPVPHHEEVVDSGKDAFVVVKSQHDIYLNCTGNQLKICERNYDKALIAEVERVHTETVRNKDTVARALNIQEDCSVAYNTAVMMLRDYQAGGIQNEIIYKSNDKCSENDKSRLSSLVGDQSALRSQAFTLIVDFIDELEGKHLSVLDFVDERMTYDKNYVKNKAGDLAKIPDVAVDSLESLNSALDFSIMNNSITQSAKNMVKDIDDHVKLTQQRVGSFYTSAKNVYDNAREDAATKTESLRNSLNSISGVLDSLSDISGAIKEVYSIDIGSINIPGVPSVAFFPFPEIGSINLPDASVLNDKINAQTNQMTAAVNKKAKETTSQVVAARKKIAEDLSFTADLLDDYDPPQLDRSKKESEYKGSSVQFKQQSAVTLNEFTKVDKSNVSDESGKTGGINFGTKIMTIRSEASFNFMPLHGSDYDIDFALLTINGLLNVVLSVDYIVRGFNTFRTVNRFWSRSSVAIEPVDVRSNTLPGVKKRKKKNSDEKSSAQALAEVVANPLTPVIIMIFFCVVALSLIAKIYSPLFTEYQNGCVHSRNGTTFTLNLNSIAFNYASKSGDQAKWEGLDQYNVRKAETCGTRVEATRSELFLLRRDLRLAQDSHDRASTGIKRMRNCLNVEELSNKMEVHKQTDETFKENYPKTFKTYVEEKQCNEDLSKYVVTNSSFECEALPLCHISCTGPNHGIVRTYTHRAGCSIGWMFHSAVFQMLVTVTMYLCLNIGRVSLINGLCRVFWRSLSTGKFTFIGTCNEYGKPDSLDKLEPELNRVLTRHKRFGHVLLLFALAIQLPWLYFLATQSAEIEYKRLN